MIKRYPKKHRPVGNAKSPHRNPMRIDPSRTITLRKALATELRKRFRGLRLAVVQLILDEDALGLLEPKRTFNSNPNHDDKGRFSSGESFPSQASTSHLTEQQRGALLDYTEGVSTEINRHLRGGKTDFLEDVTKTIASLDTAFADTPSFEEPVKVYRGVKVSEEQGNALIERYKSAMEADSSVTDSAYSSASIDPQSAERFARIGNLMLEITAAKGIDLTGHTNNPKEKELLLDRNSQFKVLGISDKEYTSAEGVKRSIRTVQLQQMEKTTTNANPTANTRWKFNTDAEKLAAFKTWLAAQIRQRITRDNEDQLFQKYAEAGFRKGAGRAFDEVRGPRLGGAVRDFYAGSRDQFLRDTFAQPVSVERIKLLAARSYSDLEGVTDAMSATMSRTLTDGLVEGKSPRDVAKDLAENVDGIGENRALVIARTEIIRAHAEGQLDGMEKLGVKEVGVAVEWSTTGDDKVCEECEPLEGVVLAIDEARNMLPRHPNCRCAWKPANVGEDGEGQKDSKHEIDSAIRESIKAETKDPDDSTWQGADAKIEKERPQGILNVLEVFDDYLINGGPGSGNFGHAGRPGMVGGIELAERGPSEGDE